ncbi:PAS domain-containing protein [Pseudaquidulcibacter saccharophilus]|uniref:PAS domain-containing protein n=1 Tax=Pseudaquidulcibacter saccharophilus TaxID=2831900 RepID=UPI001EFF07EB|nr:PAS domain-containing protein [Pseudaquidulcibacter saccharophilus]
MTNSVERFFGENELIVSKTDLRGRITYCNDVFIRISGYSESECLGQQHSLIRHADMPRCVFKLLWDTIHDGREIFAYVINRCKNGDYYWVNAHVTPSRDASGNIIGFHSNRRVPDREILNNIISPLYRNLLAEENRHANRKDGLIASSEMLTNLLASNKVEYDEFIATLRPTKQAAA